MGSIPTETLSEIYDRRVFLDPLPEGVYMVGKPDNLPNNAISSSSLISLLSLTGNAPRYARSPQERRSYPTRVVFSFPDGNPADVFPIDGMVEPGPDRAYHRDIRKFDRVSRPSRKPVSCRGTRAEKGRVIYLRDAYRPGQGLSGILREASGATYTLSKDPLVAVSITDPGKCRPFLHEKGLRRIFVLRFLHL